LRRLACVGALAGAVLGCGSIPASAGAWTKAKGEGQAIVTTARRMAPPGSMFGGAPDHDTTVSQVYAEYGLLEGLTVGAKLYVELSATNFDRSSAAFGGFLRKRLWQGGGSVVSAEAGYAHPIESLLGSTFAAADPGAVPEAHLAGLYGHGWGDVWSGAFVSTGIGYHWRGKGLADDLRAEVTAGYKPTRRVMGMLSLYSLMPLAGGSDPSLKIAPSIAYTMWPTIRRNEKKPQGPVRPNSIQLGASYDLLSPGDGLGLSISIWRSF
jgi:hypothetical protein